MNRYEKLLRWILMGKRPVWAFVSLFGVFAFSFILLMVSISIGRTKSTFFPSGDPNFVYVYLKLPVGTDVKYTDSITSCTGKKSAESFGKRKTRNTKAVLWKASLPMWP